MKKIKGTDFSFRTSRGAGFGQDKSNMSCQEGVVAWS